MTTQRKTVKTLREAFRLDCILFTLTVQPRRSLGDLVETRYIDEKSALLAFTKACDPAVNSECWIESPIGAKRYWKRRALALVAMLFLMMFGGLAQAQTFTQQFTTPAITSQNIVAVASGDFRNKGYADLVTATNSQVCIYQNDGTGNFNVTTPTCIVYGSALFVQGIGVGNFDGNGKLGIAVFGQGYFGGAYSLITGDGTGNFVGGGQSTNDLINTGGGSTSGPVVAQFVSAVMSNTEASFAMAAQDCIRSTTIVQIAGSLISSNTEANFSGCTDVLVGAIGSTGYLQSKGTATGYTIWATQAGVFGSSPFTYCNNTSITAYGFIVGYDPSGLICVQDTSSAVRVRQLFPLTAGQTVSQIIPVNITGGQSGILALLQNGSMSLLYGAGLTQGQFSISIAGPLNPAFAVADIFRATGVQNNGQDFIVVNSTGLAVFVQGIFDGAFNPTSYTFPAQAIGVSTSKQISFTNTGTGVITPVQISVTGSSDFSETNDCPLSLSVGAFCTVTVQFLPGTAELSSSATLSLTSTLVNKSVALSGSEILFVLPQLSTHSLSFANQLVNTSSAQTVSIYNAGNETLNLSASIAASSAPFYSQTNNCGSVLPQASCNLVVTFAPNQMGSWTGTVNLTTLSNPGSIGWVVSLTGTGVIAPSVTTAVANQTVVAGNNATFSAAFSGTLPINYVWKLAGVVIGGNTNTLSFTTSAAENQNQVSVTASNAYGSVTSTGVLTVLTVPIITTQPASTSVTLAQSATFNVVAAGSAPLIYSWSLGGIAAGTNSPTFTTPATVASNNGAIVKVVVSNSAGSMTSANAVLSINFPVAITVQPTSQTIINGRTATFVLSATGTNDNFQWRANQQPIVGATSSSYSVVGGTTNNGTLYDCVVSNLYGPSVTSTAVLLTVQFAPALTQTKTPTTDLIGGQSATLSVTATGATPITYQWTGPNGVIAGATSSSFTTPALTAYLTQYTVVATNVAGQATASFNVFVDQPPTITSTSGNQTTPTTATFFVVATSEPTTQTLTYQWKKGNVAIVGATSASYTTPTVSLTDNGVLFTCVVSDAAGSITSAPMMLTVLGATPSMTVSLGPSTTGGGTITAGGTASYIAYANFVNGGTAPITFSNCQVPAGFACSISSPSVTAQNSGMNTSEGSTIILITTPTTASTPPIPVPTAPEGPTTGWYLIPGLLLALGVAFATRPRYRRTLQLATASLLVIIMLVGCGGGSVGTVPTPKPAPTPTPTPVPTPTPAPTGNSYTISVTVGSQGIGSGVATATLVVTH